MIAWLEVESRFATQPFLVARGSETNFFCDISLKPTYHSENACVGGEDTLVFVLSSLLPSVSKCKILVPSPAAPKRQTRVNLFQYSPRFSHYSPFCLLFFYFKNKVACGRDSSQRPHHHGWLWTPKRSPPKSVSENYKVAFMLGVFKIIFSKINLDSNIVSGYTV